MLRIDTGAIDYFGNKIYVGDTLIFPKRKSDRFLLRGTVAKSTEKSLKIGFGPWGYYRINKSTAKFEVINYSALKNTEWKNVNLL